MLFKEDNMNDIKVLYVEDEKAVRENLGSVLSYFCSEVIVACDGQEGLEFYKKHKPDIIVTDIKMPNMSGIKMIQEIKKLNQNPYIILTSAHSESEYFMEAIEMQIDGYILKPIDINLLESKIVSISEVLKLRREFKQQEIIMDEILTLQDNMLVIFDEDEKQIFANQQFLEFMLLRKLDEHIDKKRCIKNMFIQSEHFFYPDAQSELSCIEQLNSLSDDKRVVSMIDLNCSTPKAFLISVKFIEKTKHTLMTFTEITNIAKQKQHFEYKANTDELTKIYNRAFFNESLIKMIQNYQNTQENLNLLMFDIDFFKKVNDTYGHQTGDSILIEFVQLIKTNIREEDILARWGGEEFIIILPNITIDETEKIAQKLRQKIKENIFIDGLRITCSIGIAEFTDDDSSSSIIKKVDTALYRAKENGRDRVER